MTETEYRSPRVGEPPAEQTWTTIAADVAGVPQPDLIGRRRITREAAFAWLVEAEAWLVEQLAEGFTSDGVCPYATFTYHGPSDSTSNCWIAKTYRNLEEGE